MLDLFPNKSLFLDGVNDPQKQIINTSERFERLINWLNTRKKIVVDYETSGLNWFKKAHIVGIGLASWDDNGNIFNAYIPVRHKMCNIEQLPFDKVAPAVKALLENPNIMKIGHNIKFEDHFSRREGWKIIGPRYDTMVGARLYNDDCFFLNLEKRAELDLGLKNAHDLNNRVAEEVKRLVRLSGMKKAEYLNIHGYEEVDPVICGIYCCTDTMHTAMLHDFYEKWGMTKWFSRIWPTEMRLTEVLCNIEHDGMPIDREYLQGVREDS
jgi:DNA polymerase-1